MNSDYEVVDLSAEDVQRVQAMEQDLAHKYNRDITLIAYEKSQPTANPGPKGNWDLSRAGRTGNTGDMGGAKRGSTFGYTEAQFDHYPTLADLQSKYDANRDGLYRSVDSVDAVDPGDETHEGGKNEEDEPYRV